MDVHAVGGPPDGSAQGFHGSELTPLISGSEVPPLLLPLHCVLRRSITEDDGRQGVEGCRPDFRSGRRSPPRHKLHRLSCTNAFHPRTSMVTMERLPRARVWLQEGIRTIHVLWSPRLSHTSQGPFIVPPGHERKEEIVTYIRGVGLEVSSTKTYDTGWSRRLDEGVERVSNMLSATSKKEPGAPTLQGLMEQAKSQNHPVSQNSIKELVKKASSEDHIERLKADRSKAVFGDTGTKLFWALVRANSRSPWLVGRRTRTSPST